MKRTFLVAGILGMGTLAAAQTLSISIGLRETGSTGDIGSNGGVSGGIEWVNLDGLTLTLDGSWQHFVFDLANDPITGFAGGSANGILEGSAGTLEHIRVRSTGFDGPIELWVDDVTNTITPTGGGPTDFVFGTFEGYAAGTEVIFQEPRYSGSTSANIFAGATGGVDDTVGKSGLASDRFDFQFVDNATTRWVRLTTYQALNQPNPTVRFDQESKVSFWMKGNAVPEPTTMAVLGLGALGLLRRKRR